MRASCLHVLPFKVSSYVIDELIDWGRAPDDPIYRLTFPHRDMLETEHFELVEQAVLAGDREGVRQAVAKVQYALNPHPSNQLSLNVPQDGDLDAWGLQHKYPETLLVFPRQGQTCHSYCGYCFRWAQFVDRPELKQAVPGPETMTRYLDQHPEVTDVLLTGGDPLVMRTDLLASYVEPLLETGREHVETIRIGTKAVSFWPYRLLAGPEADNLLRLLERLTAAGKHVAMMLHLSHAAELKTDAARAALSRLASTGAVLRAQAPVVRHVNDDPSAWADLWQTEVRNWRRALLHVRRTGHGRAQVLRPAAHQSGGHLPRCAATGFGPRADRTGSGDVRDTRQGRHRRCGRPGSWTRVRAAHAAGTPARAGGPSVLRRL